MLRHVEQQQILL